MEELDALGIHTDLWERADEEGNEIYNQAITAQELATDITGSLGVWGITGR